MSSPHALISAQCGLYRTFHQCGSPPLEFEGTVSLDTLFFRVNYCEQFKIFYRHCAINEMNTVICLCDRNERPLQVDINW